jgi:hypothetical protein
MLFTPNGRFETIYEQSPDDSQRLAYSGWAKASVLLFLNALVMLKMPIRTARFSLLIRVQVP